MIGGFCYGDKYYWRCIIRDYERLLESMGYSLPILLNMVLLIMNTIRKNVVRFSYFYNLI